jgi:putative CocE/NonD family hydrolase
VNDKSSGTGRPVSSLELLARAGAGAIVPPPEPMPTPSLRLRLPMRDGVQLDTNIWLPDLDATTRVPAILLRTPYKESVMGFRRLGVLRYVEAGYALVIQQIRGVGASEGHFETTARHERTDGYDTIEWIAAQQWCTGAVGMDGSSYVAMTQLSAAAERPPHLQCIVPAVPSVDFFRETPYGGGIFARQHTLNWARILQIDSLSELRGGFMSAAAVLADPEVYRRITSRPAREAADGELAGDFLAHYRNVLAHPTFDAWWRERTLSPEDFAGIDVPALVVNGNFDLAIGALLTWRGLKGNDALRDERRLLIGPWDHGQCYAGGATRYGPYDLGAESVLDLAGLRLAFFDRHLKGIGPGPALAGRVTLFITGSNEWRSFDDYPPTGVERHPLYLSSAGAANGARGDGRLRRTAPSGDERPDAFVDDPTRPFVPVHTIMQGTDVAFDLSERAADANTLVYRGDAIEAPMTVLGEPDAELHVAADVTDADVFVWLAEQREDGALVRLSSGQLRLRYRDGFDAQRLLTPDAPVAIRIPMTYVAHRIPVGSRLVLLISGSHFPAFDPNPHTGEPIADAIDVRPAIQRVFHHPGRASRVLLPLLGR